MQTNKISIVDSTKFAFFSLWQNKMLWLKLFLINTGVVFVYLFFALLLLAVQFMFEWFRISDSDDFVFAGILLFMLLGFLQILSGFTKVALHLYDTGKFSGKLSFFAFLSIKKIVMPLMLAFMCALDVAIFFAAIGEIFFQKSGLVLQQDVVFNFIMVSTFGVRVGILVFCAFYIPIIVDTNTNSFKAISVSYGLVKKNWLQLYLLLLVVIGMVSVLLYRFLLSWPLALIIALVIIVLLLALILAHAYRTAQGKLYKNN